MKTNFPKYKLVAFDLDGTLTLKGSSLQYIITQLGKKDEIEELEQKYRDGTNTLEDTAKKAASLLKGTSQRRIYSIVKRIPRLKNIQKTVSCLQEKNIFACIISVGPFFVVKSFKDKYNFDRICGSEHIFHKGIHTGRMKNILKATDKVLQLQNFAQEHNICPQEIIAVGDSRSDIPIFNYVGFKISLNGDFNVRKYATIHIETDDLIEVYNQIEDIL